MKTRQKNDLYSKTLPELDLALKKAQEAVFTLRMDHAQKKLKNTRSIFLRRKEIAQILTTISHKRLLEKHEEEKSEEA